MNATSDEQGQLTRTERRFLATHAELLEATIEELLTDALNISATSISTRADRAPGTFFNHFASVAEAIEEALESVHRLRMDAIDQLKTAPTTAGGAMPHVLASVLHAVASGNREVRAIASARRAGYVLPDGSGLTTLVLRSLGVEPTRNHAVYTSRMTSAIIDHAAGVFHGFTDRPTRADVSRLAWNLISAAVPPADADDAMVEQGIDIAMRRLEADWAAEDEAEQSGTAAAPDSP